MEFVRSTRIEDICTVYILVRLTCLLCWAHLLVMPRGLIHLDYFALLNTAASLLDLQALQEMLRVNTVPI